LVSGIPLAGAPVRARDRPEWLAEVSGKDPALQDLLALAVHPEGGRAVFEAEIRKKLRESALVRLD
jgi:hypothetical protein